MLASIDRLASKHWPYTDPAMPNLSDTQLLADCDVDTYRGSGPGGQKRNKTDSAIRLRHRPTGLIVIATESRSQAENRVRAVRRLREALALRIRHPVPPDGRPDAISACLDKSGRLYAGRRDARYLPAASALLDLLAAHEGNVSDVANRLGLTTGNVSKFLTSEDDLMAEANRIRASFGLRPLRSN
jgi:hypothetical protein